MANNNSNYVDQLNALKKSCGCEKHQFKPMSDEQVHALDEAQKAMQEHTIQLAQERAKEGQKNQIVKKLNDADAWFETLICSIHEDPNRAVRIAFSIKNHLKEIESLLNG